MINYISHSFGAFLKEFKNSFLASLGTICAIIQVIDFCIGEDVVKQTMSFGIFILLCIILAIGVLIRIRIQIWRFKSRVINSDVEISIYVCDMLKQKGDWFVPMNTAFLLDNKKGNNCSSIEHKVQGMYYKDRVDEISTTIFDQVKRNKRKEKGHVNDIEVELYSYGATARIELEDRNLYMVATNDISDEYRETESPAMGALKKFWHEMEKRQYTCKRLFIPMIGTGKSGYGRKRTKVAMSIIDSYIEYLHESNKYVARNLVLVIHPDDVETVNLPLLRKYLEYKCKFNS